MLNRRRVTPRPPKRVRNRKRPDWLRLLLSLLLVGLGAETLYVAFNSPLLAVKEITLTGVDIEGHVLDDGAAAVAGGKSLDTEQRRHLHWERPPVRPRTIASVFARSIER